MNCGGSRPRLKSICAGMPRWPRPACCGMRAALKPGDDAVFSTRSGTLTARQQGERIELDFPLTSQAPAEPPAGLLEALGITARYVGRGRFDYLIEVESDEVVRGMAPDFRRLAQSTAAA